MDTALGSANPGDYAFSSTTFESSTETITIDLTTFNPGQFVSVFVAEQSEIVENYNELKEYLSGTGYEWMCDE